jgi:heme a synthase
MAAAKERDDEAKSEPALRAVAYRTKMRRRLTPFQSLALWTTGTTYLLILVGGLVRASGAGLGCPDWPKCFGSWVPPASAADLPAGFDSSQFNPRLMWTEYLNRVLGVAVGFLILGTLVSAWRHHRRTPRIFWPTLAAFLLVGFQGWLGGVVVQHELAAWIVTIHMLVALVIVSLLLYATVHAFFSADATAHASPASRAAEAHGPRALARAALGLIAVTLVQVALGTQVREHVDASLASGILRTEVLANAVSYDLWHRELSLVVLAGTLLVWWLALTRHRHDVLVMRALYVCVMLVAAQILLGVTMAYLTLTPAAQVAHLSGSSLLLGAQTVLYLLASKRTRSSV